MHIEYAPKLSVSFVVKSFKGRVSETSTGVPSLKKRYWGIIFGQLGMEVAGNITMK